MNTTQITVQANIATDIERSWDFYTQPEHITKWNFASDDWQCPSASNDMQIGGKYSARMEAKDGSWGFDFEATYDEIKDSEGFTYTMPDGRKVTVTFKSIDNGTQVTTVFDAETQNPVAMQQQGWQAILDNFKKYAESQA